MNIFGGRAELFGKPGIIGMGGMADVPDEGNPPNEGGGRRDNEEFKEVVVENGLGSLLSSSSPNRFGQLPPPFPGRGGMFIDMSETNNFKQLKTLLVYFVAFF